MEAVLPPDARHSYALSKYRRADPVAGAALDAVVVAQAKRSYPTLDEAAFREVFPMFSPEDAANQLKDDRWLERWYDAYPLQCEIESPEGAIEVAIVNSTPREPLLAQSALGRCGDAQRERLDTLLSKSEARTILVLHHHALADWKGDHYRFERWGNLAHDSEEGARIFDLLRRHSKPEREIFLLMGHTHETSRGGFVPASEGAAHGFWYLESAAFGDPAGRWMSAAVFDGGKLCASSMPRP